MFRAFIRKLGRLSASHPGAGAGPAEEVRSRELAEHHLEVLSSRIDDHLVTYDDQWRYVFVNEAATQVLGRPREELLGRCIWELFPQAVGNQYYRELHQAVAERRAIRSEHYYAPFGKWFENHIYPAERGVTVFSTDITSRKRAEQALRESEERFRLASEAGGALVYDIDLSGMRKMIVHGLERVTGHSHERSDLTREWWQSLVHPEDLPAYLEQERQRLEAGAQRQSTYRVRHKSGEWIWLEDTAHVVKDPTGAAVQIVGTLVDVTQRKQGEEKIRLLNSELEKRVEARTSELMILNRELESFAYSVAHDLRSPLRGIGGFSQILLKTCIGKLSPLEKEYFERIWGASRRMAELIDGLLDLAMWARVEITCAPVDMSELARAVLSDLQKQHPKRTVVTRVQPGLKVTGDERLLRALLVNLLENAWKFTGKRAKALIEFGTTESNGDRVFFVRDDGAGFDMAYMNKLFKPFERLHADEFHGTGIGLAIVHRIVGRHGGKVWAQGAVEKGATFYFTVADQPAGRTKGARTPVP